MSERNDRYCAQDDYNNRHKDRHAGSRREKGLHVSSDGHEPIADRRKPATERLKQTVKRLEKSPVVEPALS